MFAPQLQATSSGGPVGAAPAVAGALANLRFQLRGETARVLHQLQATTQTQQQQAQDLGPADGSGPPCQGGDDCWRRSERARSEFELMGLASIASERREGDALLSPISPSSLASPPDEATNVAASTPVKEPPRLLQGLDGGLGKTGGGPVQGRGVFSSQSGAYDAAFASTRGAVATLPPLAAVAGGGGGGAAAAAVAAAAAKAMQALPEEDADARGPRTERPPRPSPQAPLEQSPQTTLGQGQPLAAAVAPAAAVRRVVVGAAVDEELTMTISGKAIEKYLIVGTVLCMRAEGPYHLSLDDPLRHIQAVRTAANVAEEIEPNCRYRCDTRAVAGTPPPPPSSAAPFVPVLKYQCTNAAHVLPVLVQTMCKRAVAAVVPVAPSPAVEGGLLPGPVKEPQQQQQQQQQQQPESLAIFVRLTANPTLSAPLQSIDVAISVPPPVSEAAARVEPSDGGEWRRASRLVVWKGLSLNPGQKVVLSSKLHCTKDCPFPPGSVSPPIHVKGRSSGVQLTRVGVSLGPAQQQQQQQQQQDDSSLLDGSRSAAPQAVDFSVLPVAKRFTFTCTFK